MQGSVRKADLGAITVVLALTCGFTVANIYYAQPILSVLQQAFSVNESAAALIVTLTQVGYALGMIGLVPLGDRVNTRVLASITLVTTAAALVVFGLAGSFSTLLVASVLVGATSVVVHVLVPVAASIAPEGQGGKIVGRVMMGLLLGILLARTTSSFVTAAWGWRSVYLGSAAVMLVLAVLLWRFVPRNPHSSAVPYSHILRSIARLAVSEPTLRRRALSQGLMFGAFTAFWTAIAFHLISQFGLTQTEVGLFALVGAAGALAAPIAGHLADHGRGHAVSGISLVIATASLLLAAVVPGNLICLGLAAVFLDFAVQTHQVLGQHEIFALQSDARSRINSVYMFTVFICGAAAAGFTGLVYAMAGWSGVCFLAAILPVVALAIWSRHHFRSKSPARKLTPRPDTAR